MRAKQGLPEAFPANESGWEDLGLQVGWCREEGTPYVLVDATELRRSPRAVAEALLEAVGLEFDEAVLDWAPVRRETVQAVADQGAWYERVLASDRLEAADEPMPDMASFPAEGGFRDHVQLCCEMYQQLVEDPNLISVDQPEV